MNQVNVKTNDVFENLANSMVIGSFITAITYYIVYFFGYLDLSAVTLLEVAAVVTMYASVFLYVIQARINYIVGIINTILYCWLFYTWELYAVAAFNFYLVFSLIYGWYRWGPDGNPRKVSLVQFNTPWFLGYVAFGGFIYVLLTQVNTYFNYDMSTAEIAIAVFSGVAQLLLDNKKLETWFVWFIVNVFSIYVFFSAGLVGVAVQYVFLLINTMLGFYAWYKSYKEVVV